MEGVLSVVSGYAGGHVENPSYKAVCTGSTGHIEVVQVSFDADVTTYGDVLEVFFAIHDPTSRDRQGNDAGSQYRSVIFYHSDAQRSTAEEMIRDLNAQAIWPRPIVTEVRPSPVFYPAEDYHQNYFRDNPGQGYCSFVVAPKVAKFRRKFASKLRAS